MCTESECRHIPGTLKNGPVEKHGDVDVAERSGDEAYERLAIRLRSSASIRKLTASIDCAGDAQLPARYLRLQGFPRTDDEGESSAMTSVDKRTEET